MIEIIERIDRGELKREIWQPCRDRCGDPVMWTTGPMGLKKALAFYFTELERKSGEGYGVAIDRLRFEVDASRVDHLAIEALRPITGQK